MSRSLITAFYEAQYGTYRTVQQKLLALDLPHPITVDYGKNLVRFYYATVISENYRHDLDNLIRSLVDVFGKD